MSPYAIIASGGKQYRVAKGSVIDVELLDAEKAAMIEFNEVLVYSQGSKVQVGTPTLAKAVVRGKVLDRVRGPKVIAYKYKRRKNYHRKRGHRQDHLRVEITELVG